MEYQQNTTFHFIGIKGSGMSSLAQILHDEGYKVKGSDKADFYFTQVELEKKNIPLFVFNADNVQEGDVVIAGNAWPETHEEIVRARELGLQVLRYHEFLHDYIETRTTIAVSGSHGKTSTTGLLAHTLKNLAGTSYLIGDGTGSGDEAAAYFALEACEYKGHFLAYIPDYAIVTNIDFDHPDFYKSFDEVYQMFQRFVKQAKKAIVACGEDPKCRQLQADVPVILYGLDDTSDYYATNIVRDHKGSSFDVMHKGAFIGHFEVPVYGEHNVLNALAVIAVCQMEGFNAEDIAKHIATFPGVKRRFSITQVGELTVIDDYAHHPSEIRATIDAARQRFPEKKIVAVFQPHTYSRTEALLSDFADALNLADEVYLSPIFSSAREQEGNVTIDDLYRLTKDETAIISLEQLTPLMDYHDEVILFMGAGNIDEISRKFVSVYSQIQGNTM